MAQNDKKKPNYAALAIIAYLLSPKDKNLTASEKFWITVKRCLIALVIYALLFIVVMIGGAMMSVK